ncbi:MAG: antibiotic biosynthesis monooxygenase family protein [Pseudomonadota bacterium]
MTTPDQPPIVLINTFTVAPERADALVALLAQATDAVMRHRPGFVGIKLHVSLDRTRVVNYAQWRSKGDFDAMLADPEAREHMGKAAALAERFEPVLYILAHVDDRAAP